MHVFVTVSIYSFCYSIRPAALTHEACLCAQLLIIYLNVPWIR